MFYVDKLPPKRRVALKRNEMIPSAKTSAGHALEAAAIVRDRQAKAYSPTAPTPEPTVLRREFAGASQTKIWRDKARAIPNKRVECTESTLPTPYETLLSIKRVKTPLGRVLSALEPATEEEVVSWGTREEIRAEHEELVKRLKKAGV